MSLQDRVGIGLRRFRSADERTKLKSDIFILVIIIGEREKERLFGIWGKFVLKYVFLFVCFGG